MKLKIVEELERVTEGQAWPRLKPLRNINVTQEIRRDEAAYSGFIVRHQVRLWQQSVVPSNSDDKVWRLHQEKARMSICDTLYGDVQREIIEALKELWEEGVPPDSPGLRRLEAMLPVLRGKQSETDEVIEK